MKGRVFEEAEGDRGGEIDYICIRYCVGGCCTRGSGGTAELDTMCEKSWGCKHSRRSIDDAEDLENSTGGETAISG
eukprot:10592998-Prorocentrum_lima.AAC.1